MTANPLAGVEPWDLVAAGYAAESEWVMLPFSRRAIELAEVPENAVVLDVATGPGTLALELAPRASKVHALDFSPHMLAELRRRVASRGLRHVELHQGDGQALSFAEASFDVAFSMFGLMFFPDRARGFSELCRVLKPGGRAVVSSWAPVHESSLMQLMFGALRAADPTRAAPKFDPLSLENPERFREELEGAGFTDVAIHRHEVTFPTQGPDQLWDAMARSSAPLVLLRKRLGEEAWQEQSSKAKAFIHAELAHAPPELGTVALLGHGRKR